MSDTPGELRKMSGLALGILEEGKDIIEDNGLKIVLVLVVRLGDVFSAAPSVSGCKRTSLAFVAWQI
jgi:hypothetical protein